MSMVLELFSTVLIDGAGAKAKENSDKKKLKEAEGDPVKTDQILADIEKRNKNANNFILFLMVFAVVCLIVAN